MNVIVTILRKVVVDDVRDGGDIDSTPHDVGRHKKLNVSRSQSIEDIVAFAVGSYCRGSCRVAFGQVLGRRRKRFQPAMEFGGSYFSTAENNGLGRMLAAQESNQIIEFVQMIDQEVSLLDGINGHIVLGAIDVFWLVEITIGDFQNIVGEGGTEKEGLPLFGASLEDAFDIRSKPDIEHPIGFIQDDTP